MPDETDANNPLRALPSVDALLRTPEAVGLRGPLGAVRLTSLARAVTEELRAELRAGANVDSRSLGSRMTSVPTDIPEISE